MSPNNRTGGRQSSTPSVAASAANSAVMVHRQNTDITRTAWSSSVTCADQREQDNQDLQNERRAESDRAKAVAANAAKGKLAVSSEYQQLQMDAIRQGIAGNKVSNDVALTKSAISKINALTAMREIIVGEEGEASFKRQMLQLRDEMMGEKKNQASQSDAVSSMTGKSVTGTSASWGNETTNEGGNETTNEGTNEGGRGVGI